MSASGQPEKEHRKESVADASMAELYVKSQAHLFGFSEEQFAAILEEIASKNIPGASKFQCEEFFARLHVDDLVLARGCAAANEHAWELFMLRFREKLYDTARQITREDSAGRELADSVYADLYGTQMREGKRVSKLASYSGRGSLDGWLRTVLSQEYVNVYRKQRRLVSLDEERDEGVQFRAPTEDMAAPRPDPRLHPAVDEALRSLGSEDRFILASYFLDERTLAQIARALSVHESTISRKVEKLTKSVRKHIFKSLTRLGMTRRQAEEALCADVRDLNLDIRSSLAQDSVATAFSNKEAKAGEGGS
jgi:RNA polymerase sigma-70 factor (ECF subfamily)